MRSTLLILMTLLVSVLVSAGSKHTLHNFQRHGRSISESTRFHNEYQRSDRNLVHSLDVPPSTRNTPICVPGAKWKKDCNRCWCLATAVPVCILMVCPNVTVIKEDNGRRTVSLNSIQQHGDKHSRIRRANEQPCKNGDTWMNKCNSCRCFNGHAACTRMRCRDD